MPRDMHADGRERHGGFNAMRIGDTAGGDDRQPATTRTTRRGPPFEAGRVRLTVLWWVLYSRRGAE